MKNIMKPFGIGIMMFVASISQAAVVEISLNTLTEDSFYLRNGSGARLSDGSLVRIGYFYTSTPSPSPSTTVAMSSTDIGRLYSTAPTFAAAKAALSGSFLEIGTAQIGYTSINGIAEGYFALDETPVNRPYGTSPFVIERDPGSGVFFRGWMDSTLPIESANTSPFNSISNVKLTGAYLGVIAYNAATEGAASELLVALSNEALPASSETVTFALGKDTSTLIVGGSWNEGAGVNAIAGYLTIPEPTSTSLILSCAVLVMTARRNFKSNR
jgi:hypothetical protein